MNEIAETIKHVDIEKISDINLTKMIRRVSEEAKRPLGLSQSLMVCRAIKEAYRLGVIRGKVVKNV